MLRLAELLEVDVLEPLVPLLKRLLPRLRQAHQEGRLEEDGGNHYSVQDCMRYIIDSNRLYTIPIVSIYIDSMDRLQHITCLCRQPCWYDTSWCLGVGVCSSGASEGARAADYGGGLPCRLRGERAPWGNVQF